MILYLAGPMTGYSDYNRPTFNFVADQLVAAGHEVYNPASLKLEVPDSDWKAYMRAAIRTVVNPRLQGVALLQGHEASKGAMLELSISQALGLEIRMWHDWIRPLREGSK